MAAVKFFTLLILSVSITIHLWMGELDLTSFLMAKGKLSFSPFNWSLLINNFVLDVGSKIIIRGVFPKSDDIESIRQMMNVSSSMPNQEVSAVDRVNFPSGSSVIQMNVYAPFGFKKVKGTKQLPVLLWLHGGGFVLGAA